MISVVLAALLCAGTPVVAENSEPKTVQTVTNIYISGSDIVKSTRADFTAGKYSEFLNDMDKDYQNAKKESELEGLIELRKETAKVNIHPEYIRSFDLLQMDKNKALLDAVGSENTDFAKKVKSAASIYPPSAQILRTLSFKTPDNQDLSKDEKAIVEIDLEYYYKTIHLDSLAASGKETSNRMEKHIVLEMARMNQLLQASKSFEDKELKKAIESDAASLDQRLARGFDMKDLQALGRGKIKPVTSLEERVASIIADSQSKIGELHRQLLNNLDSSEPVSETVKK